MKGEEAPEQGRSGLCCPGAGSRFCPWGLFPLPPSETGGETGRKTPTPGPCPPCAAEGHPARLCQQEQEELSALPVWAAAGRGQRAKLLCCVQWG